MEDKKEESCLEKLKKDYLKIQKKYNLPEFDVLNREFSIEKTTESETDYLIREIRRIISEKLSNFLRLVETLLNPSNAPMFVFSVVKALKTEEKEKLTEIYKKLTRIEIKIIGLDAEFLEEKEAGFINESLKLWKSIEKDILKIIASIEKNLDNKTEQNNNGREYFG